MTICVPGTAARPLDVRPRGRQSRMVVRIVHALLFLCLIFLVQNAFGQSPPVLNTVFPMGAQAGQSVELTVAGTNLQGVRTLHCNVSGTRCEKLDSTRFRLSIPAEATPGLCDLWAVGDDGLSAPRTFSIGNRVELLEADPNETPATAMPIPLNVVINGRIDKASDADHFRFEARRGQRVIVEGWAERIDSRLRATLEIFDSAGRRLDVNRGYFGIDPFIDFRVPADGAYLIKIQDLVSSGGAEHYYRLDVDTGPRVAFSVPNVIQRGKVAQVALYGWNLAGSGNPAATTESGFDRIDIQIPLSQARDAWPLAGSLQPAQGVVSEAAFPYHLPGSHGAVVIGVTDVPVLTDPPGNHSPTSAREIAVPCEVSGQLAAGDERDWFAIHARRGEAFFLEGLGHRLRSPVDLQISILDPAGQQELAQFGDETRNIGGPEFPTGHLDPAGRWVCPTDGRYLIAVRNLMVGGRQHDPRRTYRLGVRREEPDFRLVAIPQRTNPSAQNVPRGGREAFDVLAFRQRGLDGPIRVTARNLPAGVECPDVWLGPGVDRATVVVSADANAGATFSELTLEGVSEETGRSIRRAVRGTTTVRSGTPSGWGRITSQFPLAVAGIAPLRITADAHEPLVHQLYGKLQARHSPGGVVDVAIRVDRRDTAHQAPVKLIGAGLPDVIQNQTAVIPAGQQQGYISFYLPPTLSPGRYSLAVRAETTVLKADQKTETVTAYSNPVTIDVQPAAFQVEVDPFAVTQARRGETIKIGYSARRLNGFIGKMHTEIAAAGQITDVTGLRGRGETFVGQTDKGLIQIVVNDDAPLGRQPFLRLFTVGVVEDEPLYHGSCFFALEVVE